MFIFFFFNDTATTEIYTLSLHDALPISTLNLLMGAGYFLFSGVGNIGDWADVASGTVSPFIWRPAMTVLGGAVYFLLARQSGHWLGALIGSDDLSMRRSRLLSVPAYVAGGLLFCLSGLFNPV